MNDARTTDFPRCAHTGITIPECCCRQCCEAQLRRYAPWLLNKARTEYEAGTRRDAPPEPDSRRRPQAVEHCLSEELDARRGLVLT